MEYLIILFCFFCGLIFVFQAVPAVLMFVGMIKGLVSHKEKDSVKTKR